MNPGEGFDLNFKYNPLKDYYLSLYTYEPDDFICDGVISEQIGYRDIYDNMHHKILSNKAFLYKINRSARTFESTYSCVVGASALAMKIDPVEILHADSVDPEKNCPYNISFNIHHYMSENQVDRIIIGLSPTKSGEFQSRIRVRYNSEKPVISKIINIGLIKENKGYLDNIRKIDILV